MANGGGQVEQCPSGRTLRSGRRASVCVIGEIADFLIGQFHKSDGIESHESDNGVQHGVGK